MSPMTLLALVAGILAVVGLVRSRAEDLACWGVLLLAAGHLIGLV